MFGFEDSKPSQLEQLCINLSSETMQHFYNTHIFKSAIETCREEGVDTGVVIDYVDNVPCIDLISSLRTGLLSMLDVECSVKGIPATYVQKVKVQHKDNPKLFEPKHCDITRTFGIHHYAGSVVYDTSQFLETNKDVIADDIVSVFSREHCQFGFATHLFNSELKSSDMLPRGASFRISPSTSHQSNKSDVMTQSDEPMSTLTQDFHTRLDNLLRTLVHAKPHFVRCIAPNEHDSESEFDRTHVGNQVRSLQVLETVCLMSRGFPHRLRFKAFVARYGLFAPRSHLSRMDDKALHDCQIILRCFASMTNNNQKWALGRKHVFLSEGARQHLESSRSHLRAQSATRIQAYFRAYIVRRKLQKSAKTMSSNLTTCPQMHQRGQRPKPISGTPPPWNDLHNDRCDLKTIQQTCLLFGLDLERPPPVPPSRPYTVVGGKKVTFPQSRTLQRSFPDDSEEDDVLLKKGEVVVVIGNSSLRGHLVVEKCNHTIHIPFHYLELQQPL